MTSAPNKKLGGCEVDFTTQLLYCAVKTGLQVNIADVGLNVFYDLVEYSATLDALALSKIDGKTVNYSKPQSVAEMTLSGKLRG